MSAEPNATPAGQPWTFTNPLGPILIVLLLAGLAVGDRRGAPPVPPVPVATGTVAQTSPGVASAVSAPTPAPAGIPSGAPVAAPPAQAASAYTAAPTSVPASTPTSAPAPAANAAPATALVATPTPVAIPATSDQGLDSDLIYTVLVAELAGQRGDVAMAFTHYLHAAQLARDPKMAELAVRAALSGEDYKSAERGAELWLKLAPDSIGAHQVAALLRIKANDREGALTHLSRLVQLAGADAGTGYQQAGGIVSRMPDPAERLSLMQALIDLDANNPEAQQALAMVAAGAGRSDAAAAAARRALELRPDWNKPRMFLVRLLLTEGKRDEARALLKELVAASPEDDALGMLYGQFLVEEKEYSSARGVFERLLHNQPKAPDVLFAAGILSLELDDVDAARIYMTRLYQTGERRDESSFYLGQIEERAKHPAAAIDWYAKTQGANLVDAQVRIAVLHAQGGEVARAREIVQQLRDQSPEDAQMLFLVEAEILDEAGRPDDALAVYADALKAYPDDQDLLYGRAMYAVKLDRLGPAEADLRRIIEANPEHADALNALGYTLADRTKRHREALGYIERAHKIKPEEPAILDSMGWVNYKLGNNAVALDYLRRALKAMNDGEIAAHLGEVLWVMGRHDEAWAVWNAALEDYPEHAYLKDVVARHRVTQSERAK